MSGWCVKFEHGEPVVYDENGLLIADTVTVEQAHKIAAAPDMFEALTDLVDAIRFDVDKERRLRRAEAALSKASPGVGEGL